MASKLNYMQGIMAMASKWIVDRIEGQVAVLENFETGKMQNTKVNELPDGVQERDVLTHIDNIWHIDKGKTQERAANINKLFDKLKNKHR